MSVHCGICRSVT